MKPSSTIAELYANYSNESWILACWLFQMKLVQNFLN